MIEGIEGDLFIVLWDGGTYTPPAVTVVGEAAAAVVAVGADAGAPPLVVRGVAVVKGSLPAEGVLWRGGLWVLTVGLPEEEVPVGEDESRELEEEVGEMLITEAL